jgi:hypothetical protein
MSNMQQAVKVLEKEVHKEHMSGTFMIINGHRRIADAGGTTVPELGAWGFQQREYTWTPSFFKAQKKRSKRLNAVIDEMHQKINGYAAAIRKVTDKRKN